MRHQHHPIDCERRANGQSDDESQIGDIIIKRGAWIGTGVIGAGTTLTKDVEAGELVITRVKERKITGWQRPVKQK